MSPEHHAGFVALVGRPNVGKSTLLNALLEDPLAIVSPKPQTTRRNLRGFINRPHGQVVLVDTPGLGPLRSLLGRAMRQASLQALAESDVTLCVIGASARWPSLPQADVQALAAAAEAGKPLVVALNKVDKVPRKDVLLPTMAEVARRVQVQAVVPISARTGVGLDTLIEELLACLPAGPALFPADMLTDQVERRLAEDLIFEQLLLQLQQEVPHRCAVAVETFTDRRDTASADCHISARIYVERPTQKAIVVGRGGHSIRQLGIAARARIGELLGCPVHLALQVAVADQWTEHRGRLRDFGLLGPQMGQL